ncbi:hypothetical protein [Paenibacillus herberti]|uniref:Uncharacterized protein n=1 Tax=Paenibacillus herberti TaxID=1619309 RepID=A0A229P2F4_9BACL|nr:hypothetical protein [Paenibacillus herberti]OXM16124.1 hypothetical protein CGZ75_05320 [Paenibacillus herberti]
MEQLKPAPLGVKMSVLCLFIAIAAGIIEMEIRIMELISNESYSQIGVIIEANVRTGIIAGIVYVIMKMYEGKNWARIMLLVVLGIIGKLTLIIDPIQWILAGNALNNIFGDMTVYSSLLAINRIVHILAVCIGLFLMFRPAANRFFRAAA